MAKTPLLDFLEEVINTGVKISFKTARKLAVKCKRAIKTALETN